MTARAQFIQAVEAFLQAPKSLAGIQAPLQWQPGRTQPDQCVKVPIEVAGEQQGASLSINAPSQTAEFSINLVFGVCVSRLDFEPNGGHTNTLLAANDGLPMVVGGNHFHRWASNVRFVEGDGGLLKLKHAEDLPSTIRTFDSALRWFCSETNIDLPHGHHIELPKVLI